MGIVKIKKTGDYSPGKENKMYKDYRYISAGINEFYRYGKKAQEMVKAYLEPNEKGFYSIPCDGGKYYTIGTSEGKFGDFAKCGNDIISVNKGGFAYAKVGSNKEQAFLNLVNGLLDAMIKANTEREEHLLELAENDED